VSRIFLSHSSRDNRQAVALTEWLSKQRPELANEIFLDISPQTGLRPGQRWKEALRQASDRCEAVICLVSRAWGRSPNCKTEYLTAENLGKHILVARLEALGDGDITSEWQRCDLFADGPQTEIAVPGGKPVAFNTAGLYQLRKAIEGTGIGPENFVWPPSEDRQRAPYRGWERFEDIDAGVFFGRDAAIVRGMDELRAMRLAGLKSLFVVLGPSGSGKSSFLRAGLIPRLQRDDRHFLTLGIMRPERNALTGQHGLAAAIHTARTALRLSGAPLGEIKNACQHDPDKVADLLAEVRGAAAKRLVDAGHDVAAPTLVLPLDQAEELFSADAGPQAEQFVALIAELVRKTNAGEARLIVAATIRTDRYEVMQKESHWDGIGTVLFDELKPMPPGHFSEVITGPARRATEGGRPLTIAPALVNRLLADATGGADTLPLLALTLARLYTDYASTGELTLNQYDAVGGMGRVVQTAVDEILAVDPDERAHQLEQLRSAFIPWLAKINPDNDQPMRREARYAALPKDSHPLIDALVDKRLLVRDERDGQVVIEVALESLLRQWDELAEWLREERQNLKAADDIESSATAWETNDHDPAWLLTGTRLTEAEALAATEGFGTRLAQSCDFLAACRQAENLKIAEEEERRQAELRHAEEQARYAEERQRVAEAHAADLRKRSRMLRAVLVGTAFVAVIAIVSAAVAIVKNSEASSRLRDSTSRRLDYEAQAILSGALRLSDIRAFQELLAARALTDKPDNGALLDALSKRLSTNRIADLPALADSVWAFSPDGKTIATGGKDGTVRLWDATTGQQIGAPLTGHTDIVTSVAFSPDGHRVASASGDHTLRLWNAVNGQPIGLPLLGHTNIVNSVAFSPDGHLVATASADNTARIWNAVNGEPIGLALTGHTEEVTQALFSLDGQRLATASMDGTVRFWDTRTGAPIGAPSFAGGAGVIGIAFQTDGSHVASVSDDGALQLWDASTGSPVAAPLKKHQSSVTAVAFSPDGHRLVSGGRDGALQAWSLGGISFDVEAIGWPTVGHLGAVTGVVLSGQRFTSGGADSTVRTWNFAGAPPIIDMKAPVTAVAFSPDGATIASLSGDLRFWDTGTLEQGRPIPNLPSDVHGLVFGRTHFATASPDGTVQLWDSSTHDTLPPPPRLTAGPISLFGSSTDGQGVVVLSDGTVHIWDGDSGRMEESPLLKNIPVPSNEKLTSIAVNPAGNMAVIGSSDGTLQRINTKTGQTVGGTMVGHTDAVRSMAISHDGHTIVSGGDDRTVRLWNADTGEPIGTPLTGHTDAVTSIALSPDGRLVVSGSPDGTLRLWPARASTADLCDKLTANMSKKQWREWVSPSIGYVDQCPGLPVAPD